MLLLAHRDQKRVLSLGNPCESDAMQRHEGISLLEAHRSEIRAFGVQSLALFGSVSRDEAGPNSDVDYSSASRGAPPSTPSWT
jgi:hypothetical protein